MRFNRLRASALVIALGIALGLQLTLTSGCSGEDCTSPACSAPPAPGELIKSDKQRVTAPNAPAADVSAVAQGGSDFAFDLYGKLRAEHTGKNFFYSPHSIAVALAMVHAGARTNTEKQIAQTLHFSLPQERLHPAINALDLELASRGEGKKGADGGKFRLNILNAIWGQKGFPFLPSYLDVIAENYGAGLRGMNFVDQAEPSRTQINDWVAQATEQRIKDLLPQGSITSQTVLVLTNAVYFNAAWAKAFESANTKDGSFKRLDGSAVTTALMNGTIPARYAKDGELQAVELPYDGNELAMLIVLPDAGKFDAVEKAMSGRQLAQLVGKLGESSATLSMPKFEFTSDMPKMKETLSALGMSDLMSPGAADLSGIDGNRDLYVSQVVHKAFVKVNEAGTEAAAATGVVVGRTSAPQSITVNIDRPFIFAIRDLKTSTVLFVGRVLDPTAK